MEWREREQTNDRSRMKDTFWFENLQLSISERWHLRPDNTGLIESELRRASPPVVTGEMRVDTSSLLCVELLFRSEGDAAVPAVAIELGRPYQSRTCHLILCMDEITTHSTTMRFLSPGTNEIGALSRTLISFLVFVYQCWYGEERLVNQVHLRLEVSFAYLHEQDDASPCFLSLEKEKCEGNHLRISSQWPANGQVVSVCWNNNEFQFQCHLRYTGESVRERERKVKYCRSD